MGLWDFIWVTTKDIQDAMTNKASAAEQPLSKRIEPEVNAAGTGVEAEEETENEEPALTQKKTKRWERVGTE